MTTAKPVRGTRDILPEAMRSHRHVIDTAREIAARYGYDEMTTPVFEFTEVFKRSLGDTSDVVTKEMYTFSTKSGEQITLRPEATAGIARAFISGGLTNQLPLKFFYATQVASRPPTFVLFCTDPTAIQTSYMRFLENQLRERFPLAGGESRGKHIGLKPRRRMPVRNGPLDARILLFDLY